MQKEIDQSEAAAAKTTPMNMMKSTMPTKTTYSVKTKLICELTCLDRQPHSAYYELQQLIVPKIDVATPAHTFISVDPQL